MASKEKKPKFDEMENSNITEDAIESIENIDRNKLFETGLLADVKFIFENNEAENKKIEEILAHKNILSGGSPVFERMLSSTWHNTKSNEIKIDFNVKEEFYEMLRYIYTNDANLSLENISIILNLAKQYLIPNLEIKCIMYIRKQLTSDIVLEVYEAIKFDDDAIKECLDYIQNHTDEILSSAYFCNITKDTLNDILKLETLTVNEFDLFQSVYKWILSKCEKLNLPLNDENKMSIIGDSIYLIRFPLMTVTELNSCMKMNSSLITESDVLQIQDYFNGIITENLKFSCVERELFAVVNNFNNERMKELFIRNNSPIIFSTKLIIKFECEADIVLLGISVLSIAKYSFIISYGNNVQYVEVPETKDFSKIYLTNPIIMNKRKYYMIDLETKKSRKRQGITYWNINYSTVHVNNINVSFVAPELVQKIHFKKYINSCQ